MEINLTEEVVNVARCTFSNCITTNPREPLPHRLVVTSREPLELRCRYSQINKYFDDLPEKVTMSIDDMCRTMERHG